MNPEQFERATQLARQMGHHFLRAAVWRSVWAMPLPRILIIGALVFLGLTYWG